MAFTNETKYGLTDGEHIANWGDTFPIFARVVNGELYAVARSDTPTAGDFGRVMFLSVEWLKNAPFASQKSAAELFADRTNSATDSSMPGSAFVKSANTANLIKVPTSEATRPIVTVPADTVPVVVPPVVADPAKTVPDPAKPATPTPAVPVTSILPNESGITEVTAVGMSTTTKLVIGIVIAAVLGVIVYVISRKK